MLARPRVAGHDGPARVEPGSDTAAEGPGERSRSQMGRGSRHGSAVEQTALSRKLARNSSCSGRHFKGSLLPSLPSPAGYGRFGPHKRCWLRPLRTAQATATAPIWDERLGGVDCHTVHTTAK